MSQIQNSSTDTFGNGEYAMPTGMIQLNGSTDYVEVYFQSDEAATIHDQLPESRISGDILFTQLRKNNGIRTRRTNNTAH